MFTILGITYYSRRSALNLLVHRLFLLLQKIAASRIISSSSSLDGPISVFSISTSVEYAMFEENRARRATRKDINDVFLVLLTSLTTWPIFCGSHVGERFLDAFTVARALDAALVTGVMVVEKPD